MHISSSRLHGHMYRSHVQIGQSKMTNCMGFCVEKSSRCGMWRH
jgi:hypothetical protein